MVIWLVMICQLVLTRLDTNILVCPSYILVEHHQCPVKNSRTKTLLTVAYWSCLIALELHTSAVMS